MLTIERRPKVMDRELASSIITALYRTLLQREPDVEGLDFYAEQLASNPGSFEEIVRTLLRSPGYQRLQVKPHPAAAALTNFKDHNFTRDLCALLISQQAFDAAVTTIITKFDTNNSQAIHKIYEYVVGRTPTAEELHASKNASSLDIFNQLLHSKDYKINIAKYVMEAYPEFAREFFIHIPKTGGTTLFACMANSGEYALLRSRRWLSNESKINIQSALAEIVAQLQHREKMTFTISGHLTVDDLFSMNAKRFGDKVLTVVRDPIDTVKSYLRYVMTRFQACHGVQECATDVKIWRQLLQVDENFAFGDEERTRAFLHDCVRKIVGKNLICNALSPTATASESLDNINRLGIQVVMYDRLRDYILSRGWNADTRENVSTKFAAVEDLDAKFWDAVESNFREDLTLYNKLRELTP